MGEHKHNEAAPNQGAVGDGVPGDIGDQANDLRFFEERVLIQEQARGEFPEGEDKILDGEPSVDEAYSVLDMVTPWDSGRDADASDDPAHCGGEEI